MSDSLEEFVAILNTKASGAIQGTAKLVLNDNTFILLSTDGAALTDGSTDADVTMIASQEVFENIMSGDQNPTMAFMTGKLKVEGSTTRALKVSDILTG